jgi:3-deoxy-D-manno-octulosonic-acid transferase
MVWLLYNLAFSVCFLLALPYYLLRMKRRGGYRKHFGQRLGWYDAETLRRLEAGPRVWVHAVSVGEVYIALRLIDQLRARRPGTRFALSVNTSTAHTIAEKQIHPDDVLLYFPVDFPPVVRKVLRLIRPVALVIMECELWPNLIRRARAGGARVALVNGRLSERSYRGYRRGRFLTRRLLPCFDLLCVQTEDDRRRWEDLGAPPERISVTGSGKYDVVPLDEEPGDEARAALGAAGIRPDQLVLLGGSTWPGEEAALLRVFAELRASRDDLALVLVPRHAERREEVREAVRRSGFEPILRTSLNGRPAAEPAAPPVRTPVLVVDTTGELLKFYACADVIFVGKSLTQHGGQNIIEPAVYAKPILVGPHMENFPVVTRDFLAAAALQQVADEAALGAAVRMLVESPERRQTIGRRAAELVRARRGALASSADQVAALLTPPA